MARRFPSRPWREISRRAHATPNAPRKMSSGGMLVRWKSLVLLLLVTLVPPAAEIGLLWPCWARWGLLFPALSAPIWPLMAVSLWLMLPRVTHRLRDVLVHIAAILAGLVWPMTLLCQQAPGLSCLWLMAWGALLALAAWQRWAASKPAGILALAAGILALGLGSYLGMLAAGTLA